MSQKDERVYIRHMIDNSNKAIDFVTDISREDFDNNLDEDIVWQTLKNDLVPLVRELENILRSEKNNFKNQLIIIN